MVFLFFSSIQEQKTKDDLEGAFHGMSLWLIRVCYVNSLVSKLSMKICVLTLYFVNGS